MPEPLVNAFLDLLRQLLGAEPGTARFSLLLGVSLAGAVVVARLFLGVLGSPRGIVAAAFGLAVPVALGIFAHVLAEVYAVPLMREGWAARYLPPVAAGCLALAGLEFFSRRFLDLGGLRVLVVFGFAAAGAYGAFEATRYLHDAVLKGESGIEGREERLKEEINGVP